MRDSNYKAPFPLVEYYGFLWLSLPKMLVNMVYHSNVRNISKKVKGKK